MPENNYLSLERTKISTTCTHTKALLKIKHTSQIKSYTTLGLHQVLDYIYFVWSPFAGRSSVFSIGHFWSSIEIKVYSAWNRNHPTAMTVADESNCFYEDATNFNATYKTHIMLCKWDAHIPPKPSKREKTKFNEPLIPAFSTSGNSKQLSKYMFCFLSLLRKGTHLL